MKDNSIQSKAFQSAHTKMGTKPQGSAGIQKKSDSPTDTEATPSAIKYKILNDIKETLQATLTMVFLAFVIGPLLVVLLKKGFIVESSVLGQLRFTPLLESLFGQAVPITLGTILFASIFLALMTLHNRIFHVTLKISSAIMMTCVAGLFGALVLLAGSLFSIESIVISELTLVSIAINYFVTFVYSCMGVFFSIGFIANQNKGTLTQRICVLIVVPFALYVFFHNAWAATSGIVLIATLILCIVIIAVEVYTHGIDNIRNDKHNDKTTGLPSLLITVVMFCSLFYSASRYEYDTAEFICLKLNAYHDKSSRYSKMCSDNKVKSSMIKAHQ
ncbi:hypothetical protein [Photobacterium marinum]|nr:hypothetical protein [Photobacterium marinum]